MPDMSLTRSASSTAAEHLEDHYKLHTAYNQAVLGPFTLNYNTAGIDTGVTLFTPAVGDVITGLWVEFTSAWSVVGDEIGLGIAGTLDADLAFSFSLINVAPPTYPTFQRGVGIGLPALGSPVRLLTTAPIVARTKIGGNITGGLNLWVTTFPAAML